MCTKKQLHNILIQMKDIYIDIYGQDIERILLYGSYARGDNDATSDVDIVAIVWGDRKELQDKLKLVWDRSSELELEYGTIISPTVIPLAEFEQFKNDIPYYRNIEKEGGLISA